MKPNDWTPEHLDIGRQLYAAGANSATIGLALGRSIEAVRAQSLRQRWTAPTVKPCELCAAVATDFTPWPACRDCVALARKVRALDDSQEPEADVLVAPMPEDVRRYLTERLGNITDAMELRAKASASIRVGRRWRGERAFFNSEGAALKSWAGALGKGTL